MKGQLLAFLEKEKYNLLKKSDEIFFNFLK